MSQKTTAQSKRPRKAPSNQTGGTAWGKKAAAAISGKMQSADVKKLILLNFPYIIAFYMVEKAAWLYRYCNGDTIVDRLMVLFMNFGLAYKSYLPSVHTLYNKNFTERDGGILETDGDKSVQEAMTELLTEFGCNAEEGRVMDAAELREQADTVAEQQAEALKEKLAAEKPTPEATISFYVAECAEFPVMGEFHDNLTLEQALEVYDKIPAERMNGIKSIGFSLEDGSIYSGMFDLMVGGEVQADVVNHIQHYRESPLVQKAISDIKTLLEKRQASKELEERPNTRQSVREALKNRKKAQEQQSNQEQAKPKKAKKKGEMEL